MKLPIWLDDALSAAGCVLILIGLAQWNVIVTWIMAGLMLIGAGALVGKANADAAAKSTDEQQ